MIFYNYILYNGKVYEAYFDKENNKSRFFDNGHEVDGETLLALNKKYNTLKEYRINGKGKLLIGILSASIAIDAFTILCGGIGEKKPYLDLPDYMQEEYVEEEYDDGYYDDTYTEEAIEEADDYSNFYNDLYEAAGSNSEYLEIMDKVIRDNGHYMRHRDLLDTIGSLEVVEGKTEAMRESSDVMGQFEQGLNRITISPDISEGAKEESLRHELFHYLSQSGLCKDNTFFDGYIGNTLNEGMTQQLVKEYFGGSDNIYPHAVAYTNAITEIVGPEIMREAYFSNNLDLVIDELSKYVDDDNDVYSLIRNMDDACVNYDSYIASGSTEDLINLSNNNKVIWSIIAEAYYNKTGIDMYDSEIMLAYESATSMTDYLNDGEVDNILFITVDKGYFNDDYIYEHNDENDVYYYTDGDGIIHDIAAEGRSR